jgi:predicted nucleic acid-binding protein
MARDIAFADTFYFLAILNRRDEYYSRAISFLQSFRGSIVTTDWVLIEVADALSKSTSRVTVKDFIVDLRASSLCDVIPASRDLFDRAIDLYHQHSDKGWTLTDCTSFIVMRERKLVQALTGDKHFEQAGFTAMLR